MSFADGAIFKAFCHIIYQVKITEFIGNMLLRRNDAPAVFIAGSHSVQPTLIEI